MSEKKKSGRRVRTVIQVTWLVEIPEEDAQALQLEHIVDGFEKTLEYHLQKGAMSLGDVYSGDRILSDIEKQLDGNSLMTCTARVVATVGGS